MIAKTMSICLTFLLINLTFSLAEAYHRVRSLFEDLDCFCKLFQYNYRSIVTTGTHIPSKIHRKSTF